MTNSIDKLTVRPVQYRDLEAIESMAGVSPKASAALAPLAFIAQLHRYRNWYGLFKFLSWFPNPLQHHFWVYVAELAGKVGTINFTKIKGFIQISPFNRARTTWRVERVAVSPPSADDSAISDPKDIGSQLLRHSFESIWEARTWMLEVNVGDTDSLALYRQNGFQPLAQLTYWSLSSDLLAEVAEQDAELPNLLPVSNADAQLLYQLDCMSMPPLLRQVFDRHVEDFKQPIFAGVWDKLQGWYLGRSIRSGYVFEPQRKAAIGYFKLLMSNEIERAHRAELTVHPAYTWLYPKLLAQMAQIIVRSRPNQPLELLSADYQHEREEYLENLGAVRIKHALLMSRSVWHKIKEAKPEGLHLAEVFQGLQAVPRTPIPSRIAWLRLPVHIASEGDREPGQSPGDFALPVPFGCEPEVDNNGDGTGSSRSDR